MEYKYLFCSTIIPTIARPSFHKAAQSVLDQDFTEDDFELILVNDTGHPLPEADWQHSDRVKIIHTNKRRQSAARNAGAAIAKGRYLHFLDDDDWILPGAFQTLWELTQNSPEADWLYAGTRITDRQGTPLIELDHNMNGNIFIQVLSGEFIPLTASVIKSESFFAVGGFNPLLPVSEDIDLCRRIALRGTIKGNSTVIACHGMGAGSSSPRHLDLEYSRQAREQLFNEPGVFSRMRSSANSSYWHGRIVRAYLTSVVWNLQHKHLFAAISRALYGTAGFVLAGYQILSPNFWQAITRSYKSDTFLREL